MYLREGQHTLDDSMCIAEMSNVSKRFGGVVALKEVSIRLMCGRALGLLGENGAGKSTLMKILSGSVSPDSGEMFIEGRKLNVSSPKIAHQLGIQIVQQELSLLQHMTVSENIFLGREIKTQTGLIDKKKCDAEARKLLDSISVDIPVSARVIDLSTAQRQLVEIAKNITDELKILILDEPTSSLTDNEVQHLKAILETLKKRNVAIVFISHKLNEIKDMCDDIVIMRDGEIAHVCRIEEIDIDTMVHHMVGREVEDTYIPPERGPDTGEIMFEIKGLNSKVHGEVELKDINIVVRKGEIVGMFGLIGSGRTEIVRTIFGLRPCQGMTLTIDGEQITKYNPRTMLKKGVCWISEDRRNEGLCLGMSIQNNICLPNFNKISKAGIINSRGYNSIADEYIEKLSIKTQNRTTLARNLSGGNQQKVVLAKWMAMQPKVMIMDEPTRGIDVGSKSEIHELIRTLRNNGMTIMVISSELPELFSIADRIIVIKDGIVTGETSGNENGVLPSEYVMKLATIGGRDQ